MRSIGLPEFAVILVLAGIGGLLYLVAFWRIFTKAGFDGFLSICVLVPIVNVAVILYLGFADWPILRELRTLRERHP